MGKYRVTQRDGVSYEMGAPSEEALKGMLARKGVRVTSVELIEGVEPGDPNASPAGHGGSGAPSEQAKLEMMRGMSPAERVRFMEAQAAYAHASKPKTSGMSIAKTVLLVWWVLVLIGGVVGGLMISAEGDTEAGLATVVLSLVFAAVTVFVLARREKAGA